VGTVSLLPEQVTLLRTLADAYQVPHDTLGKLEPIYSQSSAGTHVQHHAINGEIQVDMGDLHELNSLGLIEMRQTGDLVGDLRVTAAGYSHLAELGHRERAMSAPPSGGATLAMDWDSEVSEVLAAVHTAWSAAPSELGVTQAAINAELGRAADDPRTALILRKLEQGPSPYVATTLPGKEEQVGPLCCEPTNRALEIFAGWPATDGEAALGKLLAELDMQIEEAEGSERKALVKIREGFGEVGKGTAAGLLVKLLAGLAG
jgi:ParB-like chromosome segregation protein Spo0J